MIGGPTRHRDPDLLPKQGCGQLMAITILACPSFSESPPFPIPFPELSLASPLLPPFALTIVVMFVRTPSFVHNRVSSQPGVIIVPSFFSLSLLTKVIVAITLSRVSSFPFLESSSPPFPVPQSSLTSPLLPFPFPEPCPYLGPSCPFGVPSGIIVVTSSFVDAVVFVVVVLSSVSSIWHSESSSSSPHLRAAAPCPFQSHRRWRRRHPSCLLRSPLPFSSRNHHCRLPSCPAFGDFSLAFIENCRQIVVINLACCLPFQSFPFRNNRRCHCCG